MPLRVGGVVERIGENCESSLSSVLFLDGCRRKPARPANAVNIEDERIVRRPACEIKDNSGLATNLVTLDVPPLEGVLVQQALAAGHACAAFLRAQGFICSAVLVCQNQCMTTKDEKKSDAEIFLTEHV